MPQPGDVGPGSVVGRRTGRTYAVGELLGRSERASVWAVEPGMAVKLYDATVLQQRGDLPSRLPAMIANAPAYRSGGSVSCAWPEDLADVDGRLAGYLMPLTAGTTTLAEVLDAGAARPRGERLAVAARLARAVAVLHDGGVVIGDFRSHDVVVRADGDVTLLGCDAMQVTDRTSGRTYSCWGEPGDLAPPELFLDTPTTTLRTTSGDVFALAVALHRLLLDGDHPFDGEWHGRGDRPARGHLAKEGLWCHAGDPRLRPNPGTTPVAVLPPTLQRYFRTAFVDGARHPYDRPRAADWYVELRRLCGALTTCPDVPEHVHGDHLARCPWCRPADVAPAPPRVPVAAPPRDGTLRIPEPAPLPTRPGARPVPSRRPRRGAVRVAAWLAVVLLGAAGLATAVGLANGSRAPAPPPAPSVTAATASTPAAPPTLAPARADDPAQALERVHAQDGARAQGLAESWVAQLATHPAATTPEGAAAILTGHDALRRAHPEALLLASADWNFTGTSWITVLGRGFATADEANAWCDAQRIPAARCFAKRLSHTGGVAGSVRYRG